MPLFTHFLDFTNTYNIDNIFLYCINQINDIYEMQRDEYEHIYETIVMGSGKLDFLLKVNI